MWKGKKIQLAPSQYILYTILKISQTYLNKTAKLLFYTISKTTSQDLGFLDPQYPPPHIGKDVLKMGYISFCKDLWKLNSIYWHAQLMISLFANDKLILLYKHTLRIPSYLFYIFMPYEFRYLLYIIIIQFSFPLCETLSYLHLWNNSQSQLWIINI